MTHKNLTNSNPFLPASVVGLAEIAAALPGAETIIAPNIGFGDHYRGGARAAPGSGSSSSIFVYCAGADHLREVSRWLGIPFFKIGVSSKDPSARIADLSELRYAGLWGTDAGSPETMLDMAGASNWFQIRFPPVQSEILPDATRIEYLNGFLRLDFARPVDQNRINEALTSIFANRCLRRFLRSEGGQHRLAKLGADPRGQFHTLYPAQNRRPARLAAAHELFVVNPSKEMPALLQAIRAMAAHLVATTRGMERGR